MADRQRQAGLWPETPRRRPAAFRLAAGLAGVWLGGCSTLLPEAVPPPVFYSLDSASAPQTRSTPRPGAPTLLVSPPRAASGFDSQRIIYLRRPQAPEYFAYSQWVDAPTRMLAPLIAAALERSGAFHAVVQSPTSAIGDLRLDTQLVRMQHEFFVRPSRVRLTLHATVVESATRRVLGWREFEAVVEATSDDPYAGVVAARQAVHAVVAELAAFCAAFSGPRAAGSALPAS